MGDWIGPGTLNGQPLYDQVPGDLGPMPGPPTPTITQPPAKESSSDPSFWMTGPLVRTGIKLSIMAGIVAYSLKQYAHEKAEEALKAHRDAEEKKKTISKPTSKPLPDPSPESTKKYL